METEELVIVYCYCCEDFTDHEVFEGTEDNTLYQCECGCVLDDNEDVITVPGEYAKPREL